MEKTRGVDVRFKGHKDIEGFALSILYLTNLKSSVEGSVIDFMTFAGTDDIAVTMYKDFFEANKDTLESKVGAITMVNEQLIYDVSYEDLAYSIVQDMEEQTDKHLDDDTDTEPEPFLNFNR